MAVLSWGKSKLAYKTSANGAPASEGDWAEVDTPKEDTLKVTASSGEEVTATEEGGDLVDSFFKSTSYEIEFDLFVKKGGTSPFTATNGIVSGEYAFKITPPNEDCVGIQIDRCVLRVEDNYSAADGIIKHYVGKCLKPASGNIIKYFTGSNTAE